MKKKLFMGFIALAIGTIFSAQAATEIVNNTSDTILVKPSYPNVAPGVVHASARIEPGQTGYLNEGYTRLEISYREGGKA